MSLIHFLGGAVVKLLPASARDTGSIPGWGRSPGEGNGNPLQYSCLGNPMDRGAWWATVRRGRKELDRTDHACTTHNWPTGKMELEIEVTIIQLRNNRHPVLGMSFRDKKTSERLSNFPKDKPVARNRADWKLSNFCTSGLGSLNNYLQWDRWRGKVGGNPAFSSRGQETRRSSTVSKTEQVLDQLFLKRNERRESRIQKKDETIQGEVSLVDTPLNDIRL